MIKAVFLLAVLGSAFAQMQSMVYTSLPAEGAAATNIASGTTGPAHTGGHAGRYTGAGQVGRPASDHRRGHTGQQAGNTNIFMRMLNNPIRLCRETENMKAIPCAGNNICNVMSMMQYRMPNLLTCSPMGIGCCLKDIMALHLTKQLR